MKTAPEITSTGLALRHRTRHIGSRITSGEIPRGINERLNLGIIKPSRFSNRKFNRITHMLFQRSVNKIDDPKSPIDVARLERGYFQFAAESAQPGHFINFGTNGHRGTSLDGSFSEAHVFAITQAICDYRRSHNITGPLYLGCSTHCLSRLAQRNALETLAGNNVSTILQKNEGATPSPVISWAVLAHNRRRGSDVADGIILGSIDNRRESGCIRYHSPTGPADRIISKWIQDRANELLRNGLREVKRALYSSAIRAASTHQEDFILAYTANLQDATDLNSIRAADLSLAVDPMGGATLPYWERIRETYRLKITLVNPRLHLPFGCVPPVEDGNPPLGCSQGHRPASLRLHKDRSAVSFGNNPTGELQGVFTRSGELLRGDDFLGVAIQYLLTNRLVWPRESSVGKTFLTSLLIDRVVLQSNRRVAEMPAGFHWFAAGLLGATICFGADESGGATFLCKDGTQWTTERDGILLTLLAAEITARTGKDPGIHYQELAKRFGNPHRTTIDLPLDADRNAALQEISPDSIHVDAIGSEPVLAKFTRAPANDESIGGLKLATANGWVAFSTADRPNSCKLSAESLIDRSHLDALVTDARQIIEDIRSAGPRAGTNPNPSIL